jgi:hypothetical protein
MNEQQKPKKTYVSEVQDVIELGYIDEETAVEMYQGLAQEFAGRAIEIEEIREELYNRRKDNLADWHAHIDLIVKDYDERLSWRNVKVEPSRFKKCRMPRCNSIFYDVARNGKTITCNRFTWWGYDRTNRKYKYRYDRYGDKMSVCAVNLDKYRRAAGGNYTDEDLLWPRSNRSVEEFLVDLQPGEDDAQGHAILNEMQEAYTDY